VTRAKVAGYRSNSEHEYFDRGLSGLMESLPAGTARSLIHVFDCPSCQDLALADLAELIESRDDEQPPEPSAEVAALADDLLGTPDGKWAEALKDPRFHRVDLMDRLMEDGRFSMESRAALAICLGAQVEPADPATSSRMMLAYCLEATSHRQAGRLRDAEKGLDNAACFLTAEPRDVGPYSRTLALLRWEQGRLYDAAAHLRYGAQAFGEVKLRLDQGVCLALLGLVYLEAGEMKRAPFPLFRGMRCLGNRRPSLLSMHGSLALALSLAQIGWEDEAREAREQAWLTQVSPESAGQAEVSWLEGRTSMALGENGEAHRLLDAARAQLLAGRRFADAALASLDLAALYARTGRRREIGRLVEDLEQAGLQRPEAQLGADNLREFIKAGPSSKTAASMAAMLSTYLRRAFRLRFPGLQTLPWT
jgi:tetratricopeptide (TPR) repeat protein